MVVGQHVNTSTYKIAETGVNIEDQMLDYAYIVGNQTDPPLVHSISYGEYGGSYDNNTVQRFNYELQKMAARGITVMLASGDNGVGCNTAGTEQEFDFPSSPYITMVGATYLDAASGQEIGATLSSGGFSKDYYRPSWQDAAVASYFASPEYKAHSPSEDFYADGRAYPDVAAFGQNVQVVSAGKASGVSGTSCSAPIFAGVIALLNHELLSAGKAPMGWINPWIYANPQMFTDVTEGSNPYQKCDGFVASKGWDPVTGMGTPVYPEMLKAALAQ
ncbi:peptidase S8/S53 domain-containing protein [Ochromonadaceae sp. CCMP2298]|nr:peptidase S8/S53 domain-containing protein [Ochromonadaceae sp. CCMP2298]